VLCTLDIPGLARFAATTQQQQHKITPLNEIYTVSSADMDPQFPDSTTDRFSVTQVTQTTSFKARKDAGFRPGIAKPG
jgi:hypothetical protein